MTTPQPQRNVVHVVRAVNAQEASNGQHPQVVRVVNSLGQPRNVIGQIAPGTVRTSTPQIVYNSTPQVVRSQQIVHRVVGSAPTQGAFAMRRPNHTNVEYDYSAFKRFPRSMDKSKGLRHFSTKVCEKVKEKIRTTYNEVADELVQEYFDSLTQPPNDQEKQSYDMKNIRRRVYDALNVLMAMNIIEKEKKEIRWVGLPTSSAQECQRLETEKAKRQERINEKCQQVHQHIMQLVMYQSLVARNRESERSEGRPPSNTLLYLPYILVNTHRSTTIDCSISNDKTEYLFNFDQPFEIHDDAEVLRRMNLTHGLEDPLSMTAEQVATVKSMIPPAMHDYVDRFVSGEIQVSAQPVASENGVLINAMHVVRDPADLVKPQDGEEALVDSSLTHAHNSMDFSTTSTPMTTPQHNTVMKMETAGGSVGMPRSGDAPLQTRATPVNSKYMIPTPQLPARPIYRSNVVGGGGASLGHPVNAQHRVVVRRVVHHSSQAQQHQQPPMVVQHQAQVVGRQNVVMQTNAQPQAEEAQGSMAGYTVIDEHGNPVGQMDEDSVEQYVN